MSRKIKVRILKENKKRELQELWKVMADQVIDELDPIITIEDWQGDMTARIPITRDQTCFASRSESHAGPWKKAHAAAFLNHRTPNGDSLFTSIKEAYPPVLFYRTILKHFDKKFRLTGEFADDYNCKAYYKTKPSKSKPKPAGPGLSQGSQSTSNAPPPKNVGSNRDIWESISSVLNILKEGWEWDSSLGRKVWVGPTREKEDWKSRERNWGVEDEKKFSDEVSVSTKHVPAVLAVMHEFMKGNLPEAPAGPTAESFADFFSSRPDLLDEIMDASRIVYVESRGHVLASSLHGNDVYGKIMNIDNFRQTASSVLRSVLKHVTKSALSEHGYRNPEEEDYEGDVRRDQWKDRRAESPPSSSDYRKPGQGDPEMDAEEAEKWDRYEEENPAIDELIDILEDDEDTIYEMLTPDQAAMIVGGAFALGVLAPVAWFFTKATLGGLFDAIGKEASARQWKKYRQTMAERERELDEQRKAELILLVEFLTQDGRFDMAMRTMADLIKRRPRSEAKKKQLRKEMRAASIEFNKIVRQIISDNEETLTSKKAETFVNNIREMLHSGKLQAMDRAQEFAQTREDPEEEEVDSEEYVRLAMEEPPYEEFEGEMQAVRGRAKSAGKLSESGCGAWKKKIHVRIGRKS